MTDINLKTLSPDTSLPTTGFLFGADSQASTNPSVYSTQTVATTLLGSTSLTGDTLTASAPVLDLAQTWNSVGTTFTGVRFNAAGSSSTNSAAASLLLDLQVGGTSKFNVNKIGQASIGSTSQIQLILNGAVTYTKIQTTGVKNLTLTDGTNDYFAVTANGGNTVTLLSNFSLGWCSSSTALSANDTFLTRKNTRIIQLGEADASTALAQTLSVQSVVAGTSNTAGAAFTINGSIGTGTGAGGSIVFQVAPAGGSGTAQNALQTALSINSLGAATFTTTKSGNSDAGSFLAPNMGVGNTTFLSLGRVSSPNDLASFGFYFAGSGSSSNAFTLAFHSTGNIWGLTANTTNTLMFLGGQTSSFPALKRSSTTLQARLADDSAFASVQGKLTTDTAYTAGTVVPTGYITIYDSTGTAYRVPCLV